MSERGGWLGILGCMTCENAGLDMIEFAVKFLGACAFEGELFIWLWVFE